MHESFLSKKTYSEHAVNFHYPVIRLVKVIPEPPVSEELGSVPYASRQVWSRVDLEIAHLTRTMSEQDPKLCQGVNERIVCGTRATRPQWQQQGRRGAYPFDTEIKICE